MLLYELLAGSTRFDAKELTASGIDAIRKAIEAGETLPGVSLGERGRSLWWSS